MRDQIHRFNEMIGSAEIDFTFEYADLSDRPKSRVNKLYK